MTRPLHPAIESDLPLPSVGDWFVLHTRSRQEKVLAGELLDMGIDHYLPVMEQVRFYGRRKRKVWMPVFPSYLFLRGELDQAYLADRTRRVARIIRVSDQTRMDWELQNIHMALACEAPLEPFPYLDKGVRVEVRSGPFKGVQGVIEAWTQPARLRLQIEMLGQAMSVEVDASLLDPIDRESEDGI